MKANNGPYKIFKKLQDLYEYLEWEIPREGESVCHTFSLFVPERIAKKIKKQGPNGVLAKEFLPHHYEINDELNNGALRDPIGDKQYQKAPQLVHRYKSRALFTPTSVCPIHCRYCFRKNELSSTDDLFRQEFAETLLYLKEHPEINEIIFTGGDPLSLSNEKLEKYLEAFSSIPTLKHIRLHSRYPVILPERINHGFLDLLTRFSIHFQTLSLAIHANHCDEFDLEVDQAIESLSKRPVQLLSQTVLLKDINNSIESLSDLMNKFIQLKIRPYYLHHPDQVFGGMHFYIPLSEGRKIYSQLRQILPGWGLPQYVIDIPGGHGKVQAYNPENTHYSGRLINKNGELIQSKEPELFV